MAETRVVADVPRRDDAFLVDGVRVCPLADNEPRPCFWVINGRPGKASPGTEPCVCAPPPELWGKGA